MAEARFYFCAHCNHKGSAATFGKFPNRKCPNCGEDEETFPYREYRCKGCGKTGDQEFWFPELGWDIDPLEEHYENIACETCGSKASEKLEEELRAQAKKERRGLTGVERTWIESAGEKPAELEEIQPNIAA